MKRDLYRTVRMLRDQERGISPDSAWISCTRERLLMQVRNSMPTPEAAQKNRATIAAAYPSLLKLARGPVLAVIAIVAVLLGGSLASVRAADRSLPGDALYALKLVTEQTRIALAHTASGKVKLKAEFTKGRVEDLKFIVAEPVSDKEARVSKTADMLKQDLHTLKEQLTEVQNESDPRVAREVAETVKALDRDAVEAMKTLKETKKGEYAADVKRKVADAEAQAADVGLKALEMLVGVRNEDSTKDVVSDDEIGASLTQHAAVARETVQEALTFANTVSSSTTVAQPPDAGVATSSVSGLTLANDAQNALNEVQLLLEGNMINEAIGKLREASTKSFLAQTAAQQEATGAAGENDSVASSTAGVSSKDASGAASSSTEP
jgi:gas vesicle protein